MRQRSRWRRRAALTLLLTLLAGPATLARDRPAADCDTDKEDCATAVIELDGNPNVFYVGDGTVTAPRFKFNYAFGPFSGGYLGVNLVNLTPELREHFGVPDNIGVLVGRVEDDTPAAAAGVEVADVITAVDGEEVESASDLARLIRDREDGDRVELELYRDGSVMTLEATIAERKRSQFDVGKWLKARAGDDGNPFVLDIDPQSLKESIQHFHRLRLSGESGDDDDLHFSAMEKDLQEKIEALEKRLEALEKQLDDRN